MTGNGSAGTAATRIARMAKTAPRWVLDSGPQVAEIVTSRVRLARNLASTPFPPRSTPEQQSAVVNRLCRVTADLGGSAPEVFLPFDELPEGDLDFLVERRLASRELAHGHRRRGILVNADEDVSVLVNEEDHLRLQTVLSGLRLGDALDRVADLDRELDTRLEYAYDPEFGYLTACPTNAGTGLRASVLAHLPALVLTRRAKKVVQGATAMGLAIRGFHGEGTELMGNFFQISNQTTLGRDENSIVNRLDEVVRQILGYEAEAREVMWGEARVALEDKVYRAHATLGAARSITADEVVSLASAVRFGIAMEMEGLCSLATLNTLLLFSQSAHVSRRAGRELKPGERRVLRAEIVRGILAGGPPGEQESPSRGM